jgi:aspartate-semialdehyde dehydrogenase
MVVVLKPIHDVARIKRIVVSTYQAVSGTGKRAIKELESQVLAIYNQQEIKKEVYPHQIAFNCLPHIDVFFDNGYTKEELKQRLDTAEPAERPTVIDVRLKYPYEHSGVKLPGALRVSPKALDTSAIPRAKDVVAYDSDPDDIVAVPQRRRDERARSVCGSSPR